MNNNLTAAGIWTGICLAAVVAVALFYAIAGVVG